MNTKILLLEDDAFMQNIIMLRCAAESLDVCLACSADEAMKLVQTEFFALVVLDVMLPIKNGVDVACFIAERNTKLPFLFISGKNRALFLDDFKNEIAEHSVLRDVPYIMKPFNLNYFMNKVLHIISTGQSVPTDQAQHRFAI